MSETTKNNFQQRFKNRATFITRHGIIDNSSSIQINSPKKSQVFQMPNNNYSPEVKIQSSDDPKLDPPRFRLIKPKIKSEKSEKKYSKKQFEKVVSERVFRPYTILDYRSIKSDSYYELRGLGPNLGNEEWEQKKKKFEKRIQYARIAQVNNIKISPRGAHTARKAAERFLTLSKIKNPEIFDKSRSAKNLNPIQTIEKPNFLSIPKKY